jgi:Amt family ammonium transporter
MTEAFMRLKWVIALCAAFSAALSAGAAFAQDAAPASDTARYAFDTALLLVAGLGGIVVIAGFCLRDVGYARMQNAPAVCLRTMGGLGVCILAFWLTGYNLVYTVEDGGLLGEFSMFSLADDDPMSTGRASGAFWFLQMALAAIGVAVVSGAVSERVKLWPFLFFAAAYSGLVYPIIASWTWGGGYLRAAWSFYDYGGGAIVHISAGAAAFAAAFIVGPRPGRYDEGGMRISPSTALPLSAFGALLIFAGWLMTIAGMERAFSSVEAVISVSTVAINAILAGGGGIVAAMSITKIVYHRAGLVTGIGGLIGALVAISADPLHPALWQACMIGAASGVIVAVAPPFLDRLRVDDAAFVVPTHFLCGLWGALIVPWTNPDAWIPGQVIGVIAIAVFSWFLTMLIWVALKYTVGVRSVAPDEQYMTGGDG